MCDELGIKCVSEGVETQQQVEIMANMGCKEFQGFYFSKPLSAYHYTEHIKQQGLNFNPQKIPTS